MGDGLAAGLDDLGPVFGEECFELGFGGGHRGRLGFGGGEVKGVRIEPYWWF